MPYSQVDLNNMINIQTIIKSKPLKTIKKTFIMAQNCIILSCSSIVIQNVIGMMCWDIVIASDPINLQFEQSKKWLSRDQKVLFVITRSLQVRNVESTWNVRCGVLTTQTLLELHSFPVLLQVRKLQRSRKSRIYHIFLTILDFNFDVFFLSFYFSSFKVFSFGRHLWLETTSWHLILWEILWTSIDQWQFLRCMQYMSRILTGWIVKYRTTIGYHRAWFTTIAVHMLSYALL